MSEQSAPSTPAPKAGAPRRSWRRWLLILGIGLLGLFLLITIVGEIIFSTDLPRNLVVSAFEKQLGLKMSAQSLSTGWLGNTELGNVTLTLPLSDKAFATVPTLKLRHTSIPWLLLSGSLTIKRIEIDDPMVAVVQGADGSWNLLEVLQLITRAGGSKNAEDQQKSDQSIPSLPALYVNNATLVIDDNRRRSLTIKQVGITGLPDGPLVYQYDAAVPDHLNATGKVAPGGAWAHEVTVHAQNLVSWAAPWTANLPQNTALDLRWAGQVKDGAVAGRLEIQKATYGDTSIAGPVDIVAQDGGGTLKLAGLHLVHGAGGELSAVIDSGRLVVSGSNLQIQQVGLSFAGGRASLDGKVGLSDGLASLTLAWRDVAIPASANQSGTLSLDYAPSLGQPHLNAILKSTGSLDAGAWDAEVEAKASGPTIQALTVNLSVPRLRFQANSNQAVDLSGLAARIEPSSDGYRMTTFQLGASSNTGGQGGYITSKKAAWLSLYGNDWQVPGQNQVKVGIDLLAWADPTRVHVDHLYLTSGLLSTFLDGEYVADRPKPISAHLDIRESEALANATPAQPFRGQLEGSVDLNGTFSPLDLSIEGIAKGTDVHIKQRPLGDLKLHLLGGVINNQVWISSRDIELLGGSWQVRGTWPIPHEVLRLDQVSVKHLSLARAAARNDVRGSLDGDWAIDVNAPTLDGITIKGQATVTNFALGVPASATTQAAEQASATAAPSTQPVEDALFAVDRIDMPDISLEYGAARIAPILLHRSQGGVSGEATLDVSSTVEHPEHMDIKIDASTWPFLTDATGATVSGGAKGKFSLDLLQRFASGHLDLTAAASWKGKPAATAQANLEVERRQATLTRFSAKILSGDIDGTAHVDLDHPMGAVADFNWKNVDLNRLGDYYQPFGQVSGKVMGSLKLAPATGARPLEPLYLAMRFNPLQGKVGRLALGKGQVFLFIGPHRAVSDVAADRVSGIEIAGGQLDFWGRVSRHEGDLYQSLAQFNLTDIDLDKIIPPGAKAKRTPGLLNGQITLIGQPGMPQLATALGELNLSHSDLASTGPIGFLYGLMHLGHDSSKPTGTGTIELSLQNETLLLPSMRYFDKGAEVRISGQIGDLLKFPDCPLAMTAVGSARPLAKIDLPAFGDFDSALSAIQGDAVSIKIDGTINKPHWYTVPFGELGTEAKNFLLLDAFSSHSTEGQ